MDDQLLTAEAPDAVSRRRLLGLIGAGAAGAAIAVLSSDTAKAGHAGTNVLHLGEDNSTDVPTTLSAAIPTDPDPDPRALSVFIPQGRAIHGNSAFGVGIHGSSTGGTGVEFPIVGVEGEASLPDGEVPGDGGPGPTGVHGSSITLINVGTENEFGVGGIGPGVAGDSGSGPGVLGNSDTGPGVAGFSATGPGGSFGSQGNPGIEATGTGEHPGVYGRCEGNGPGGLFESPTGFGIQAHSENLVGVGGFSITDLGVLGIGGDPTDASAEGDGIGAFSFNSVGGRFVSFNGIGVRAVSPGEDNPALQAASGSPTDPHAEADPDGGLAFEVIGKSRFSTAGSGTVSAGDNAVAVANPSVTAKSHIGVTLISDPGPRQVGWVERQPGTGFTVHLTFAPPPQRPATDFTYLIVDMP